MCAESQLILLRDLWQGFSPHRLNESWFVIFRGYMDESYGADQNIFAWSCLIATGSDWFEMERQWKLHLRAKNKALVCFMHERCRGGLLGTTLRRWC